MIGTWAKLGTEWYTDPVIRAAAALEPMTLAVWPILIAKAKHASSLENIGGTFQIVLNDLAAHTCTDVPTLSKILENLVDGELITMTEQRLGIIELELVDFTKWQTPRGTKKERDERYREHASREKAKKNVVSTTHERRGDDASTSPVRQSDDLEREIEREREKRENNINPSRVRACEADDDADDDDVLIFQHWVRVTERDPVGKKLTRKRRELIAARRADGYDTQQLLDAIEGLAGSSWHRGENPHGVRFDTFEACLKDEDRVERGLEYFSRRASELEPDSPGDGFRDGDEVVELSTGESVNLSLMRRDMEARGDDPSFIRMMVEWTRDGRRADRQWMFHNKRIEGEYDDVQMVGEHDSVA